MLYFFPELLLMKLKELQHSIELNKTLKTSMYINFYCHKNLNQNHKVWNNYETLYRVQ